MFIAYAPLEGRRHIYVSESGTRKGGDYAQFLRLVAEEWFGDSPRIVLVQDNLSTHTDASLYKVFEPEKALALARRFERHRTPKHGSWLNMAECELSVLSRQCLSRRIASVGDLRDEGRSWAAARNAAGTKGYWQFSVGDARTKLASLYPTI